ncbi:uncharacterized protein EV420DRAFT_301488 [Desarmillaria tabescens]|uniref:Uncharacterized protein n=1 Tax=Armillaria tabescens TaxID=1929756 RepID=A0AA39KDA4_ARMTA|nr:uncharacterized protein EV420DRAFT_301488 [Desarmillaria tabescens]KAK0459067.1 hypothetical protein EV420DRAFT_301488 [Desarmillaria tabescens]
MGVFVGLVLISAMLTCLRRRRLRNSVAKHSLAQLSAPVAWPPTQLASTLAPPPPVYAPPPSYQQPVVEPDNNAASSPAPVQSNNPFRRYPYTETASPPAFPEVPPAPASSGTQGATSQTDDPYDTHATAHRQQATVLAKYSRTSNSNQLSESAGPSTEPQPPPYTEQTR